MFSMMLANPSYEVKLTGGGVRHFKNKSDFSFVSWGNQRQFEFDLLTPNYAGKDFVIDFKASLQQYHNQDNVLLWSVPEARKFYLIIKQNKKRA